MLIYATIDGHRNEHKTVHLILDIQKHIRYSINYMKEIKKSYLFASKKFHQSFVMMLAGVLEVKKYYQKYLSVRQTSLASKPYII